MYSYGYIVSVSKPNALTFVLARKQRNKTQKNPKTKKTSLYKQRENIAVNQHFITYPSA